MKLLFGVIQGTREAGRVTRKKEQDGKLEKGKIRKEGKKERKKGWKEGKKKGSAMRVKSEARTNSLIHRKTSLTTNSSKLRKIEGAMKETLKQV